ncbi:MAG: hypothetical protein Q9222_001128 [Ikaeria aurantiellina]
MGNASSQFSPPPTSNEGSASKGSEVCDVQEQSKRRSPSMSHSDVLEEAWPPTSMLSQTNGLCTPQSNEDDAAASAQLLAESSPTQFHPQHHPKQGKRKHKKRRRSVLEASSDAGNLQNGFRDISTNGSQKLRRVGEKEKTIVPSSSIPQSIYSLDDIDENEEGLASLFQEYETQASQPRSPFSQPPKSNVGDSPIFSQALIDPALLDQPLQPVYDEAAESGRSKQKRKWQYDSNALEVSVEPESLNGRGQHAFEIDFQAFDDIFANEELQSANPFNKESGDDLPIGTEPHARGVLSYQSDEYLPEDPDSSPTPNSQRPGKLPRILSGGKAQKRQRMEMLNSLDSQVPIYVSPYADNEGQQDRVLPGLEDMQLRSSSEIPYSRPTEWRNDDTTLALQDTPPKEALPPPLPTRTKTRGNKRQQGGRKGKDYKPSLQELSDKGGMFRDDEIKVLEAFRDRYCDQEETSEHRFNELIHSNIRGNHEVMRLFHLIYDEIPYRTHQSITRFCRRHFHNYAVRGAWTASDDEKLRNAVAKKGKAWQLIGATIGRFPEDCRDRYRNYLVNSEQRKKAQWTHEETRNLVKAVDDAIRSLREARLRAKEEQYEGRDAPESDPESNEEIQNSKFINWPMVSERMGGTRSRLQCAYKWNSLKNADRDFYLGVIRRLENGKGLNNRAGSELSKHWRLNRAMKKLRNMKAGDRYDFLQVFADCDASSEASIPWQTLGTPEFRERWSTVDMKAALETFKREVPRSEGMSYQEVVNRVYTRLIAENPYAIDERWDPEVHGDINKIEKGTRREQRERDKNRRGKLESGEARRLRMEQQSGRAPRVKSEIFVDSDDAEEDGIEKRIDNITNRDGDDSAREETPSRPEDPEDESQEVSESPGIQRHFEAHDRASQSEEGSVRDSSPRNGSSVNASLDTENAQATPEPEEEDAEDYESDDSLFNDKDVDGSIDGGLMSRMQLLRET